MLGVPRRGGRAVVNRTRKERFRPSVSIPMTHFPWPQTRPVPMGLRPSRGEE